MLEHVGCRVLQVFIFTEHVEVSLGVFVKNDAVIEVNCVLLSLFSLAFPNLAFFLLVPSLAYARVNHLGELSVVSVELGVVEDA